MENVLKGGLPPLNAFSNLFSTEIKIGHSSSLFIDKKSLMNSFDSKNLSSVGLRDVFSFSHRMRCL